MGGPGTHHSKAICYILRSFQMHCRDPAALMLPFLHGSECNCALGCCNDTSSLPSCSTGSFSFTAALLACRTCSPKMKLVILVMNTQVLSEHCPRFGVTKASFKMGKFSPDAVCRVHFVDGSLRQPWSGDSHCCSRVYGHQTFSLPYSSISI